MRKLIDKIIDNAENIAIIAIGILGLIGCINIILWQPITG